MAIPFLAGYGASQLLEDERRPLVVTNNIYIPLTNEQADLYMSTLEFTEKLDTACKSIFLYIDRNNSYKPKALKHISTGRIAHITYQQAQQLINAEKKLKRASWKTILMTKGINGLPEPQIARQINLCTAIIKWIALTILCSCCLPCIIKQQCCNNNNRVDLQDGASYYALVDQYRFNLLQI